MIIPNTTIIITISIIIIHHLWQLSLPLTPFPTKLIQHKTHTQTYQPQLYTSYYLSRCRPILIPRLWCRPYNITLWTITKPIHIQILTLTLLTVLTTLTQLTTTNHIPTRTTIIQRQLSIIHLRIKPRLTLLTCLAIRARLTTRKSVITKQIVINWFHIWCIRWIIAWLLIVYTLYLGGDLDSVLGLCEDKPLTTNVVTCECVVSTYAWWADVLAIS